MELGVPRNRLYKWRDALQVQGEHAFPGPGRRSLEQLELTRLRRELARVMEENVILKKATAYFVSASKRGTPGSKGSA